MTDEVQGEIPEDILVKLNKETSKIAWSELLPFFATGMAIYVSHTLDLIKVGKVLADDNKQQFEAWIKEGLVANVSDEQASVWHESNVTVWAVDINPGY